ncbi:MAG: hypothetical protein HYW48_03810 [Deltaproteobacteria bacterium]|nr:hypothetical protein [Deltaproteobacteria bacterium]
MNFKIIREDDQSYRDYFSSLKEKALEKEARIWSNLTHEPARIVNFLKRFSLVMEKWTASDEKFPEKGLDMLKSSIQSQKAKLSTIQGQAELDKLQDLLP